MNLITNVFQYFSFEISSNVYNSNVASSFVINISDTLVINIERTMKRAVGFWNSFIQLIRIECENITKYCEHDFHPAFSARHAIPIGE